MKKIISLIVIIFLLTVIGNLIFSISNLWSKKDLLIQTKQRLAKEQQEHVKLQVQWQQVNTPSFIEEQARDKLFLSKPGEAVVLLPIASPSGQKVVDQENKPVWQQWWELFF